MNPVQSIIIFPDLIPKNMFSSNKKMADLTGKSIPEKLLITKK